jgi:hypothetical protein
LKLSPTIQPRQTHYHHHIREQKKKVKSALKAASSQAFPIIIVNLHDYCELTSITRTEAVTKRQTITISPAPMIYRTARAMEIQTVNTLETDNKNIVSTATTTQAKKFKLCTVQEKTEPKAAAVKYEINKNSSSQVF